MHTRILAALGALALLAIVALQEVRIERLNRSVAGLELSLATLGGQIASVAKTASSTASSAALLASDLSASSKAQTAALKSQSTELQDAVAVVTPSVVSIIEQDAFGETVSSGTGFVVRSNGYIVTNEHVVADGGVSYVVLLASGKQMPAQVVWRSSSEDLAVVKIAGSDYRAATLGNASTLALGSSVFAVGNALGRYQNTVSVGVVSGLDRSITAENSATGQLETLTGVIQTDAAINPGNSGGPLADLSGRVVGINVAVVRGSQSIGFALPIAEVKKALVSLGI